MTRIMATNETHRLGDYIRPVDVRNRDLKVTEPMGINIDKHFMPSVANVIGTDLSTYKLVSKNQFACNLMHVGRDEKIPMAMHTDNDPIIVSPAYFVFEITNTELLLPEYLMMWFRRPEFDRNAWFHTAGDVRGGLDKNELMDMQLPVPDIERQREIVSEYETLTSRIRLNEQMIEKLEATAQALYRHTFVDNIDKQNLPQGWHLATLGEVCSVITKGTTPSDYSENRPVNFVKAESISPNHCIDNKMLAHIDGNTHNSELKRSIIKENDILFTIAGTLGKFCIADKTFLPANTNQAVAIIRVDKSKIHPIDIYAMFVGGVHEDYCKRNIQQAVQANLNLETISKIPIVLPPNDIMNIFQKKVLSVFNAIYLKQQENIKLIELQSLLLAKMGKEKI